MSTAPDPTEDYRGLEAIKYYCVRGPQAIALLTRALLNHSTARERRVLAALDGWDSPPSRFMNAYHKLQGAADTWLTPTGATVEQLCVPSLILNNEVRRPTMHIVFRNAVCYGCSAVLYSQDALDRSRLPPDALRLLSASGDPAATAVYPLSLFINEETP